MYDSVRVICLSNLFLANFFQNAQKHIDRKPQSKDLRLTTDLSHEVKEGVQCMLVKFFARKAAWLKFTARLQIH